MHIPDGFLNTAVSAAAWVGAAGGIGYGVRRVNREMNERQVPLMGVTAAFIFAAQMLNFTVAGGTSGHLLGGALAMILLGPWAGGLVLTAVLIIQALLFQDGGLVALGANIFNMAVVGDGRIEDYEKEKYHQTQLMNHISTKTLQMPWIMTSPEKMKGGFL